MSTANTITDHATQRCGLPSPATSTSWVIPATTKRARRGTCSPTSGPLPSCHASPPPTWPGRSGLPAHGMRVAPRSTGHGPGPLDGAMLLNTARMRHVDINSVTRTARAQADAQ